jgi:hypothetical protein
MGCFGALGDQQCRGKQRGLLYSTDRVFCVAWPAAIQPRPMACYTAWCMTALCASSGIACRLLAEPANRNRTYLAARAQRTGRRGAALQHAAVPQDAASFNMWPLRAWRRRKMARCTGERTVALYSHFDIAKNCAFCQKICSRYW